MSRNTPKRNLSSSSTKDSEKKSKIFVTPNRYASLSEDADSPPEVFSPPPVKLSFQDQLNIPPANMESLSSTKVQTPPFYVSEGYEISTLKNALFDITESSSILFKSTPKYLIKHVGTDISVMDQCSIFIRYVVDGMIHERLISVKSCIDSTGKGMMNLLKKAVDTVGLDITHCIGNATDGAANMRGAYNGFTSWLSEEAPGQESYQRMNLWKELSEKDNIHKRLQAICETRWTAKETAIKRLFGTYNSLDDNGMLSDLLLVLTKIVQNSNLNPDVRSKARNSMWCGNVIEVCNTFITNTNNKIETMAISYKLNVEQIQSTFKEKRMAKKKKTFNYENEEDLITTPEKKFTIEVFNTVLDTVVNSMNTRFVKRNNSLYFDLSLLCPKNFPFNNLKDIPESAFLTLATKLKPFIPFNDNKENNVPDIRNRLSEELWNFSNSWKYLKNSLEEEYDKITLNETIGEDQDEDEENYENLSTPCNLTCKSCSICCYRLLVKYLFSSAYSLLTLAYKYLLTLPVTQVSCERSFSTLKYLKNRLRNSMANEKLESFMLMSIEKSILMELDNDTIINELGTKSDLLSKLLL
ncbi:hypothetical protein QTP88_014672 [Uroleucon formosanum]